MALPSRPTDIVEWAEDPSSLVSEPQNERSRGFPFAYVPPVNQANWLQRAVGRWINYLRRSAGGGFSSLPDLIDSLSPGECAPLITPDLRQGREIDRYTTANEILSIAVDGQFTYIAEITAANTVDVFKYDGTTASLLYTATSVVTDQALQPVLLLTGGDAVFLCHTVTGSPLQARAIAIERDGSGVRWSNDVSSANNNFISSAAVGGASLYITVAEGSPANTVTTYALNKSTGATAGSAVFASSTGNFVKSVAGDLVILADGDLGVLAYSLDLSTELWTFTATGTASTRVTTAIDDRFVYVVSDTGNLYLLRADTEFPGSPDAITSAGGEIIVDDVDLILLGGVSAVATNKESAFALPTQIYRADDINVTVPLIDFASDSQAVYLAGETTTPGTWAIWVIAKGQAPKIWRRLDPADDDAWPRTLAAPI